VPRLEVGAAVRAAFETYNVGRMFGDPPKWATELESWADEFRQTGSTDEERERVLAFDTNQHARFAKCVDRFRTALAEGTLSHAGDARLTAHVEAARLKKVRVHADEDDQRTMYVIIKPEDGRKIDAAVAAVLAHEAAMTMPAEETKPLMPLGMWR
jgi:phage terminase large subunit-like protein